MQTLLTKKEFAEILQDLQESSDIVDKIDEIFLKSRNPYIRDFCSGASLLLPHEALVVELLEKIMSDTYGNISYFIYELDYGRSYEDGMVTDEDGSIIDFSTAEKLYDYLTSRKD